MQNTKKKSKSMPNLCMKLNNLKMDEGVQDEGMKDEGVQDEGVQDEGVQEATGTVKKDKGAAKLKQVMKLAQRAIAKAEAAKEKLKKLQKILKLKQARIMKRDQFDGPSTSKEAQSCDEESRSDETESKKKLKSKAVDKKSEARAASTSAGSKTPSNIPDPEEWNRQLAMLLEFSSQINYAAMAPRKGKKQ